VRDGSRRGVRRGSRTRIVRARKQEQLNGHSHRHSHDPSVMRDLCYCHCYCYCYCCSSKPSLNPPLNPSIRKVVLAALPTFIHFLAGITATRKERARPLTTAILRLRTRFISCCIYKLNYPYPYSCIPSLDWEKEGSTPIRLSPPACFFEFLSFTHFTSSALAPAQNKRAKFQSSDTTFAIGTHPFELPLFFLCHSRHTSYRPSFLCIGTK
jgi:hypothetical protein